MGNCFSGLKKKKNKVCPATEVEDKVCPTEVEDKRNIHEVLSEATDFKKPSAHEQADMAKDLEEMGIEPTVGGQGVAFVVSMDDDKADDIAHAETAGKSDEKRVPYKEGDPLDIFINRGNAYDVDVLQITCPLMSTKQKRSIEEEEILDGPNDKNMSFYQKTVTTFGINVKFSNTSELNIDCSSNGKVLVSNPDPELYKSAIAYISSGNMCQTLMSETREIVSVSQCNYTQKAFKLSFSSHVTHEKIIGGLSKYRIYLINCQKDEEAPKIERVLVFTGGSVYHSVDPIFLLGSMCYGVMLFRLQ